VQLFKEAKFTKQDMERQQKVREGAQKGKRKGKRKGEKPFAEKRLRD
jgi:flagellar biosynthesis/type III secretory pathway protein FliH